MKNVPDEVHQVWKTRASAAGMTLQEFLLRKLTDEAHRPTAAEVFARIERRGGPKLDHQVIVDMIREDRESRGSLQAPPSS